ncbi:MAG: hypothetical protein F4X69_13895 [Gemmatimonadetes bacterium]|nr:hypothetical protein [Gemmatimonadota bacterium]
MDFIYIRPTIMLMVAFLGIGCDSSVGPHTKKSTPDGVSVPEPIPYVVHKGVTNNSTEVQDTIDFSSSEIDTITILSGSVRVSNTSGGRVIVVGQEDAKPLKPMFIHFKLSDDTDIDAFRRSGIWMTARLGTTDGVEKRTGPDGTVQWTSFGVFKDIRGVGLERDGGLATNGLGDLSSGRITMEPGIYQSAGWWRSVRDKAVNFYLANRNGEDTQQNPYFDGTRYVNDPISGDDGSRWIIRLPTHTDINYEVTDPIPSQIVFHPVVPGKAGDDWLMSIDRERSILERTVLAQRNQTSALMQILKHSPIVVSDLTVGPAIIVDMNQSKYTDGWNGCEAGNYGCYALRTLDSQSVFYDCDSDKWGMNFAPVCIVEDFDRSSTLDFHIAVVSSDVHDDKLYGMRGAALIGTPYSMVNLTDSNDLGDVAGTILHEMGHSLGLLHILSTGTEIANDGNYPVPDGYINVDGYEKDLYHRVHTISRNEHFDFMSYQSPSWISAYHYRKMAEYRFGIEPTLVWGRRSVMETVMITCP